MHFLLSSSRPLFETLYIFASPSETEKFKILLPQFNVQEYVSSYSTISRGYMTLEIRGGYKE